MSLPSHRQCEITGYGSVGSERLIDFDTFCIEKNKILLEYGLISDYQIELLNQFRKYLMKFDGRDEDFVEIINTFNCHYPQEFISYQLHYCYLIPMGANNTFEPHMSLYEIVKEAMSIGVPDSLAPFREENGDFYCFNGEQIVVWSHKSASIEKDIEYTWDSFTTWLMNTMGC